MALATRKALLVCGILSSLLYGAMIWTIASEGYVGGLLIAYGSLGLLWPFAPMHSREALAAGGGTLGDTMHVVLAGATVLLMFVAMGFAAGAFGKRFRLYSIASIVVLVAFGALTFRDAPRVQANLSTPWIGLWERIDISVFLFWIVVLAIVSLRGGAMRSSIQRSPT
jgi:hypothetical protein